MGSCSRLVICFVTHGAADNVVKIWSPLTGELIRNLSGHTKGLSDISWSSDGTYLASASDDTSIRIWNVESVRLSLHPGIAHGNDRWAPQGVTTKHLRGHTSFVFCLNCNTASTLLVSGGCEGDVRIWNVARGAFSCGLPFASRMLIVTGKCIKTLSAHLDYVTAVHFNRDASLIVSCSLDGLMCVPLGFIHPLS